MVWFLVDDKAHSNNKIRKVLAEEPAALSLWTVAGSWSADNLTDGFVPDHQLPWLFPAASEQLAQVLVTARLWRRVRGGYQFHQWSADGNGSRRNPTRAQVEDERRKKAEAGRKGGVASANTRSKREARASAHASPRASGVLQPHSPSGSNEPERGARHAPRGAARAPTTVRTSPTDDGPTPPPPNPYAERQRSTPPPAARALLDAALQPGPRGQPPPWTNALDELRAATTPPQPEPETPTEDQ